MLLLTFVYVRCVYVKKTMPAMTTLLFSAPPPFSMFARLPLPRSLVAYLVCTSRKMRNAKRSDGGGGMHGVCSCCVHNGKPSKVTIVAGRQRRTSSEAEVGVTFFVKSHHLLASLCALSVATTAGTQMEMEGGGWGVESERIEMKMECHVLLWLCELKAFVLFQSPSPRPALFFCSRSVQLNRSSKAQLYNHAARKNPLSYFDRKKMRTQRPR